ncbi:MAG: hypothetical protein IJD38_05295 [Clostridia bacterium]|nr:hypothetical protein [Clostridia bacterium]
MNQRPPKYSRAKKAFRTVKSKHRLFLFYDIPSFPPAREEVERYVDKCAQNGIGCIIPRLPRDLNPSAELLSQIAEFYELLTSIAIKKNTKIGLHLEPVVEQSFYLSPAAEFVSHTRTRTLIRRQYFCDPKEKLYLQLRKGTSMSVMAYDDEHTDMIDLRPYIRDGYISYTVPDGNWTVEEYICTSEPQYGEPPIHTCNILSYDSSMDFLKALFAHLGEGVNKAMGSTVTHLFVSDICFHAPNRRNWDEGFNEVFEKRFGFDPAPYYPALYHFVGERDPHIKSLFMACRAEMLRSGLLAALKAFSDRSGLHLITAMAEPKLPACSWLNGDALGNSVYSPCAVQEKAYLYGMNSTHLAASAADNFGSKYVTCELFRDYSKLTTDITYKDAMNAFGHGANLLIAHWNSRVIGGTTRRRALDRFRMDVLGQEGKSTFSAFVARVQTLLRGGSRVNDIAMLYPIYALHDKVYLYEAKHENGFEYPNTPFSCNYMTVLNTISTYAGEDITLLHPETVNSLCSTEDGILYLKNPFQTQKFRILILPGADMISLDNFRLIKKYFDEGGKIVATGTLPKMAFEYRVEDEQTDPNDFMSMFEYGTTADREVRSIARHIFGEDATNPSIIKETFYNANDRGGEAYYIPSHRTAADGTELTDCAVLNNVLQSFHVPLDMYMPEMPRFECIGAFNNPYTEFLRLGLDEFIPGGGMISHIHKQRGDLGIFFFANTTDRDYGDTVYIRGIHSFERWDPHTGKTSRLGSFYVRYRGEIYTRTRLYVPAERAVFLVSRPDKKITQRVTAHAASLRDVTAEINMMESSRR